MRGSLEDNTFSVKRWLSRQPPTTTYSQMKLELPTTTYLYLIKIERENACALQVALQSNKSATINFPTYYMKDIIPVLNPLSPNIHIQLFLTDLHTFSYSIVGRIC